MKINYILPFAMAVVSFGAKATAQVVVPTYQLHKATITLSVQYESAPVVKPGKDGSSETVSIVTEKLSNGDILEGLIEDVEIAALLGGTIKGCSIVAISENGKFKSFAISKKGLDLIDIREYLTLFIRKDGSSYLGGTEIVYGYKTDRKAATEKSTGRYITTSQLKIEDSDIFLKINGITEVGYLYSDDDFNDEVEGNVILTSASASDMFGIAEEGGEGGRGFTYVSGGFSIAKGVTIEQPAFLAEVIAP